MHLLWFIASRMCVYGGMQVNRGIWKWDPLSQELVKVATQPAPVVKVESKPEPKLYTGQYI